MGDDFGGGGDFGDFGNGGDDGGGNGGDDSGGDNGFDDQPNGGDQDDNWSADDQSDDDQPDDDQPDDQQPDDQDGPHDDDNLDDVFVSSDDLPPVDDDVFASADDFPNAEPADFTEDTGGWCSDDYQASAENLFGDHPFFGDTLVQQKIDEGFQPYHDPQFGTAFDQIAPGTSDTVELFEREGRLVAFGLVSQAVLQMLMARYTGIDWNNIEVATPFKGEPVPPQPLPVAFANVTEQDSVDLRKYCTPISDQGQTGRCSAFAWTHANEMSRNILNAPPARLSPNYTMLEIQRYQGDARDYQYAYEGGDGTAAGPEPGELLAEHGTCRQELWPDYRPTPTVREEQLQADAERYRLEATPWPIAVEDVRKVLSAGCPVHVSMNTGRAFSGVGRDGVFNAAEAATGRHGRHAMLIVGYVGNFFTLKNSWGTDWGDQGYCYIPRNVLAASDPEFVAVLIQNRARQQAD